MKVVLLDRDGTLIVDPTDERVDGVEKIKLFPDTLEALSCLADRSFKVIIVTNQAGIAEGRISEEDFWKIHSEVINRLSSSGVEVLKTYMSGDAPGTIGEWRKPAPGMLLQAAKDFDLDLTEIYMVGDSQSDIEAGINAGCKGGVLVKTATNHDVVSPEAVYTAQTLLEAVKFIIEN